MVCKRGTGASLVSSDFTESEWEQRIITHIQKFLMELGKGYAFVARQQHIRTEKEDYYIDLVFYNYILKCFVLIDCMGTNNYLHLNIKPAFHQKNSFGKRLKFRSDFIIYRKKKTKKIKIFKI